MSIFTVITHYCYYYFFSRHLAHVRSSFSVSSLFPSSITPPLFHSWLKAHLFHKSFSLLPSALPSWSSIRNRSSWLSVFFCFQFFSCYFFSCRCSRLSWLCPLVLIIYHIICCRIISHLQKRIQLAGAWWMFSCASSPVLKTRQMAAQALSPLLSATNIVSVLSRLIDQLQSASSTSSSGVPCHNLLHGSLLQVTLCVSLLQCFDAVGWMTIPEVSFLEKLEDDRPTWLTL